MVFRKEKLGALLSKVGSGVTPKGGSDSYVSEGVPLIRSQNVLWGKLSTESIAYIEAKQHAKMSGSVVRPNDVLLNITGASIGRACVVPSTLGEANVNQHVCILRVGENLDSTFLCNFLISQQGQREIALFQAGGNREGLNYEQVRSFEIPLPSLAEQRKIAEILRTWDEAIETAEAELRAKQERKRGLMIKCLGPAIEARGVNGWRTVRLGEICNPQQWATIVQSQMTETGIPVYGANSYIGFFSEANHEDDVIAVSCRGSCGEVAFVSGPSYVTGNSMCLDDLSSEKVNIYWLYQCLKLRGFRDIISGSAQPQIIRKDVIKVKISLPPLPAQEKTAEVLLSADHDIETINNRIESLRTQKRGLMQKLLTGEVRVAA